MTACTASQMPMVALPLPESSENGLPSLVCSARVVDERSIFSTPPSFGRVGVLLPRVASDPRMLIVITNPRIETIRVPQMTARVVLRKSFITKATLVSQMY